MNIKKSLESRIRGWFPKEPTLQTRSLSLKKQKIIMQNGPLTLRERLVGGLGAAGGGTSLLGVFFYFAPTYPKLIATVLIVIGLPLLASAFIVRATYENRRSSQSKELNA